MTQVGFSIGLPDLSFLPVSSIYEECILESVFTSFLSFHTRARRLLLDRKPRSPRFSFTVFKSAGICLRLSLTVPHAFVRRSLSRMKRLGLLNQLSRKMLYPWSRRSSLSSSTALVLAGKSPWTV